MLCQSISSGRPHIWTLWIGQYGCNKKTTQNCVGRKARLNPRGGEGEDEYDKSILYENLKELDFKNTRKNNQNLLKLLRNW